MVAAAADDAAGEARPGVVTAPTARVPAAAAGRLTGTETPGGTMSLLRTAIKAGIAKKLYDEARKPHNQKMLRDLVGQLANSRSSGRQPRGGHGSR